MKQLLYLWKSDLNRLGGGKTLKHSKLLKFVFLSTSFFQCFWYRLSRSLRLSKFFLWNFLGLFVSLFYHAVVRHLTGIQLHEVTEVGEGLCFYHYGAIVIAQDAKIGKNCSLHQDVTIGLSFAGDKKGAPVIGDNVVIFPGAKIIGKIKVGDNAVIAAGAIVINDVPENAVVAGNPARIISKDSSKCFEGYWKLHFNRKI